VIASNLSMLSDSRLSDEIVDLSVTRHQVVTSVLADWTVGGSAQQKPATPWKGRLTLEPSLECRRIRERLGVAIGCRIDDHNGSQPWTRSAKSSTSMCREGFRSIFLRPLSPYGFAARAGHFARYDAERWLDFYK